MSSARSPLIDFLTSHEREDPQSAGLYLSERPFLGYLILKGEGSEFLNRVERCLEIPVPVQANTLTANDEITLLWLAPNEWLLIAPSEREGKIADKLRASLDGVFGAVTDVTHNQTVLHIQGIQGDRVLDVLRKGCSLNFHPSVFGPNRCAQTLFDKVGITILRAGPLLSFDLIVRRSFAEYVALRIKDAAEEYGFAVGKSSVYRGVTAV
jgi:heterotetrameric sarcosine oxidase gamma subunit